MYRIGEFSKITELSVRTLRYYDAINLLKPKFVDEFTSYRYYTDENINEANYIKFLKELDFSLDEIMLYQNGLDEETIDKKINEEKIKQQELDKVIIKLHLLKEELVKTNVKTEEHKKERVLKNTNIA